MACFRLSLSLTPSHEQKSVEESLRATKLVVREREGGLEGREEEPYLGLKLAPGSS